MHIAYPGSKRFNNQHGHFGLFQLSVFVLFLFVFDLLFNIFSLVAICWERAVPLAFHLCCFYFSAVFIVGVGVPFPFGV